MSDTIRKKLVVEDEFSDTFRDFKKGTKEVTKGTDEANISLKKSTASLKAYTAAIAGASVAVGALVKVGYDSINAYKEQEIAERRLEGVARNVTKATKDEIKALKDLASARQRVTVVGDEVTISGQSQLLTFGMTTKSAMALTSSLQDVAVANYGLEASGDNAIQVANMLGKVYMGQVGALTEVGISLSETQKELIKTGDESQRVATIADVVAQNFGGMAEEMAKTDSGKIVQLKNDIGDLKEEIGAELMPVVSVVVSKLQEIASGEGTQAIITATKHFVAFATGVAGGLDAIFNGVSISFMKVSQTALRTFSVMNKFNPMLHKLAEEAGTMADALKDQSAEEIETLKERMTGYGDFINQIYATKKAQDELNDSIVNTATGGATTGGVGATSKPKQKDDMTGAFDEMMAMEVEYHELLSELRAVDMAERQTLFEEAKSLEEEFRIWEQEQAEQAKAKRQQDMQDILSGAGMILGAFSEIYQARRNDIESQYDAEIEGINASRKSAKTKEKERKKAEQQKKKDLKDMQKQQAIFNYFAWVGANAMTIAKSAQAVVSAASDTAGGIGSKIAAGVAMAGFTAAFIGQSIKAGKAIQGREFGGNVRGGSLYEVAERGKPEMFSSGGKDYLLSPGAGKVTPMTNNTSNSRNYNVVVNVSGGGSEEMTTRAVWRALELADKQGETDWNALPNLKRAMAV